MTIEFFNHQMDRLAGLRFAPADMTTHWEALHGMPDAALEAAVTRAQGTRVDFPTPIELKQDADQAAPMTPEAEVDRGRDLATPMTFTIPEIEKAIHVTREWSYYCETCSDSGWRNYFCGPLTAPHKPWLEHKTCDRRHAHAPHEWVDRCLCVSGNPELQRRAARDAKYATKAGKATA